MDTRCQTSVFGDCNCIVKKVKVNERPVIYLDREPNLGAKSSCTVSMYSLAYSLGGFELVDTKIIITDDSKIHLAIPWLLEAAIRGYPMCVGPLFMNHSVQTIYLKFHPHVPCTFIGIKRKTKVF